MVVSGIITANREVYTLMKLQETFTRMSSVRNTANENNTIKKGPKLTHEKLKSIIKKKEIFDTDAAIQLLFDMGYTSHNISQRPNDIEVLVRLLRQPSRKEKKTKDCFD